MLPVLQPTPPTKKDPPLVLDFSKTSIKEIVAQEEAKNAYDPTNATQQLARKIAEDILQRNPNGPFLNKNQPSLRVTNPEVLIDQYLAANLPKETNTEKFKPVIQKEDLHIVQDQNKTRNDAYLQNVNQLIISSLAKFNPAGDLSQQLQSLASIYETIIQTLYQLTVPALYANYHQQVLSIFSGKKMAIADIQNYLDTDPLRAIFTLQTILNLNQELATLQQTL